VSKAKNAHPGRRGASKKNQDPKGRELTPKQRALVKGVAEGKSVHRAALDAGYSPHTAKCDVYQNPRLRLAIADLMDRVGLNEEALLKAISDALTANKRTRADHPVRLRASETGLRLRGYLGRDGQEAPEGPAKMEIIFQQVQDGETQVHGMTLRVGASPEGPARDDREH